VREAVVAPIGFLCDHVEVLYDLDIDAKKIARDAGLRVERAEALNDHPLFIRMLSESVVGASQRTAAI
jgi:ferrochelatase